MSMDLSEWAKVFSGGDTGEFRTATHVPPVEMILILRVRGDVQWGNGIDRCARWPVVIARLARWDSLGEWQTSQKPPFCNASGHWHSAMTTVKGTPQRSVAMTDPPLASIDTLIERLYAAEPGDRLRITLPERPPYVVTVVTNDSTKPREETIDDGETASQGRIQVNVNVVFDDTPVEEPAEIGPTRGISATRQPDTGAFDRPTLGVMVDSSPSPGAEPDWNADPRPIEQLDGLE
jgi:hypothetical protein